MSEDERVAEEFPVDPTRHRGEDLSRILSLSDGVFAFAFTLLVLQLTVPAIDTTGRSTGQISSLLAQALVGEWGAIYAFALGAIFIGLEWMVHHRVFQYIRRFDSGLLWLNIAFLAAVALNPFLLGVYIRYSDTSAAVMLYGGGLAITVGFLALLWWYASYHHRLVDRSLDRRVIGFYRYRLLIVPTIFALSVGVAYSQPAWGEYLWIAAIWANVVITRRYRG
jgi:uncharacterized membrane protein